MSAHERSTPLPLDARVCRATVESCLAVRPLAVLGLGLIGGSLLHASGHAGYEVVGYDIDPATAAAASAAGFPVRADRRERRARRRPGRARHAAAAGGRRAAVARPAPALRHAVLTDVGTLKAPVLAAVRELSPRALRRRPSAGRHRGQRLGGGRPAAVPRRARGRSPSRRHRPRRLAALAELVCDLGAKPVPATAAEQDAAVARVIGLPHVLAEALALTGLAGGPLGLSLAAGSYLSGSRVARTRPDLVATWCDGNPPLVAALDDVIRRLTKHADELADDGSVLTLAEAGHEPGWTGSTALRAGRAARRPRRAARARPQRRLDHRGAPRRRRRPAARHAATPVTARRPVGRLR